MFNLHVIQVLPSGKHSCLLKPVCFFLCDMRIVILKRQLLHREFPSSVTHTHTHTQFAGTRLPSAHQGEIRLLQGNGGDAPLTYTLALLKVHVQCGYNLKNILLWK